MNKHHNKGFVLVVCLIFLAILSVLTIFMSNGFIQDIKMAGNYREKSRALDAAQSALNSAEIWLGQPGNSFSGTWVTGTNCAGSLGATPVICSNALTDPTAVLESASNYTPYGMTVQVGQANSYATNANLHIQFLGTTSTNPPTALYLGTSMATGGNDSAVAVIKTVYKVQATSYCISCE